MSRNGRGLLRLISLFVLLVGFCGIAAAQDVASLAKLIRSGNTEQKREALRLIRNARTEVASRLAIPALRDGSEIVRATAAGSVIFLPKQEAIDALVPLLSDKSAFVRKEAAYAIGEVGDPTAIIGEDSEDRLASALRLVLVRDKDPEVRAAAAVAMGTAGGLKSVWYLYFYLQESRRGEEHEFIRRSAVRSIGTAAESIRTGARAVASLQRPTGQKDSGKLDLSREVRAFGSASRLTLQILQDTSESDDIRREAARALGNIGDVSAIPALTASLNAKDPYLANNSREALRKLKAVE